MYFKLAFRNVRRSVRDYTIYFLTLTFGVCVFYVFNSIESQQAMMSISSSDDLQRLSKPDNDHGLCLGIHFDYSRLSDPLRQ